MRILDGSAEEGSGRAVAEQRVQDFGTRVLHGDYALISYHDQEGYILTIEGRLIGKPKSKRD